MNDDASLSSDSPSSSTRSLRGPPRSFITLMIATASVDASIEPSSATCCQPHPSLAQAKHVEQQRDHRGGGEAHDKEGRGQDLEQGALEQEVVDPRAGVQEQRRQEDVEEELVGHDGQEPRDRVAQPAQGPPRDHREGLERGAGEQQHRGAELAAQHAGQHDREADEEDRVLARVAHGAEVVGVWRGAGGGGRIRGSVAPVSGVFFGGERARIGHWGRAGTEGGGGGGRERRGRKLL